MSRSTRRYRSLLVALLVPLGALSIGACASVQLVGQYDEQVDQGATRLQKGMDTFLTRLEALPAGAPERHYAASRPFYLDYGVDLRALETRAASLPKNAPTVEQLQLMERNVESLRATHESQDGLGAAAIAQFRTLFNAGWRAILTLELAKKR